MSTFIVVLLMGILIGGSAMIFRYHRRRAAESGIVLHWGDVFTRYPPQTTDEGELRVRRSAIRDVRSLFMLWLFLCFLIGMWSPAFLRAEIMTPANIQSRL